MRVLSLFDGISCGRVALDRVGITPSRYYASEIDKHAIKVSRNNWSDIIHMGCVKDVADMARIGAFGEIDILMGGSPCQGFSQAGTNGGFDDYRSILFFEFIRVIQFVKPRYFLLENVKMKREWLDVITAYMGVTPILINSADFSAQNRKRYYWTNIPVIPWVPCDITLRDVLENDDYNLNDYKLNRTPSRESMWADGKGVGGNYSCVNLSNRDKSNTLTTKQDRFSNAGLVRYQDFCRYITPLEAERLQTLPDNYTAGVSNTQRYKALGNGWTVDVIAHILRGIK